MYVVMTQAWLIKILMFFLWFVYLQLGCPQSSNFESILNDYIQYVLCMHLRFPLFFFFSFWSVFLRNICRTKFAFLRTRFWMAARASILGCRLVHYKMKKRRELQPPHRKNLQNHFCIRLWVRSNRVWQASRTGSVSVILISVAALSKPHLFESRGHNRQGSDSSVDCFTPKEEPPEPEPDNKVQTVFFFLHHKRRSENTNGRRRMGVWLAYLFLFAVAVAD